MSKFVILFAVLFVSYSQAGPFSIRNIAVELDNFHESMGIFAGPTKQFADLYRQVIKDDQVMYAQASPMTVWNIFELQLDKLHQSMGKFAGMAEVFADFYREELNDDTKAANFEAGIDKGVKTLADTINTIAQKVRNKDLEGFERFRGELKNAKKEINDLVKEIMKDSEKVIPTSDLLFFELSLDWFSGHFSEGVEDTIRVMDMVINYKRQDSDIV